MSKRPTPYDRPEQDYYPPEYQSYYSTMTGSSISCEPVHNASISADPMYASPNVMTSATISSEPVYNDIYNEKYEPVAKERHQRYQFPISEDAKKKKVLRAVGGQVWNDPTLNDWDNNDFRIFCGDLGHEVTDDMLYRAFQKYPSLSKARVIRDKRSKKSKGYGFVSFKEGKDYMQAMKEMDGKFVGSRPIKLRKSDWKKRLLN